MHSGAGARDGRGGPERGCARIFILKTIVIPAKMEYLATNLSHHLLSKHTISGSKS